MTPQQRIRIFAYCTLHGQFHALVDHGAWSGGSLSRYLPLLTPHGPPRITVNRLAAEDELNYC